MPPSTKKKRAAGSPRRNRTSRRNRTKPDVALPEQLSARRAPDRVPCVLVEAMTDMLDAILEAKAAGAGEAALAEVYALQRTAMWRLDYISSENSKTFHAAQEAARILGESIDYSRRAQAAALRLRAPPAPETSGLPREPVRGVTDRSEPPGS